MNHILTIEVPFTTLVCDQCRSESSVDRSEADSLHYNVVHVHIVGPDEKEPICVPLDIKKIQWYKEGDGWYVAYAVVSLPCPGCGDPRELRYHLQAPAILLTKIGICRTCGGELALEEEELVYTHSAEDGPQIEIRGNMRCKSCVSSRFDGTSILAPDFSLLKTA
jgi:hypothetical protein